MDKLYLSVDIEGVTGIVDWIETEIGEAQGAYFRKQMTREAAAACEAAVAAGVKELLVKDAHGSGRSIDPSALPRRARIMRAWTRDPYSMMAGLEPSFGGAFYLGYHSSAGSDGNPLAHTMNGNALELRVNGRLASELLLNSYTAASMGVPSLLVSGDAALCADAEGLIPGVRTVAVSEGRGNASVSIHPELAVERIAEAAAKAVADADEAAAAGRPGPMPALPKDFELELLYKQHYLAYRASFYPGAERRGPNLVRFRGRAWLDVLSFIHFAL